MLYYSVAAKLMSTKEVHHMEDLKSSRTGLSAASMWIQTDGGCKLEGRKHFNKSNVWAVHKEDKKGKTEAGRWRGDRSRAETDGEKRPGTDFLSALSSLLPVAPPGLLLSHISASPSTSSLTCSQFVFQPGRLTSCLSIPWGWRRWAEQPHVTITFISAPEWRKTHVPMEPMSWGCSNIHTVVLQGQKCVFSHAYLLVVCLS